MKNMKKILALLVAVLMIAASVSALAEAPDMSTFNQSVKFTNGDEGNTVVLVKLLSATIGADNSLTYTATSDCPEDYNTEAKILAATDLTAMANAIGAVNGGKNSGDNVKTAVFDASGEATINAVEPGWYYAIVRGTHNSGVIYKNMLINTTPKANANNGWDIALNNETGASSVAVKKETDEIYKGIGDTAPTDVNVQTSDGYSVGDDVPYTITTHIPNYPSTSIYAKFNIVDTPNDLTDKLDTVSVTVEGDTASPMTGTTEGKFTVTRNGDDGFKIEFAKNYVLAHPNAAVTVHYTATIKSTAVIATDGETADNTAHIEFNPNPYVDEDVKPDDTTKLYTYGVYVHKYDQADNHALAGAEFSLTGNGNTYTGTTDANGYIDWNGLEAGTYTLTETKAPAGYKLRDPASITIVIDKDNPTVNGSAAEFGNDPVTDETETKFLGAEIPNTKGQSLPSTGGMGTTILYIGGSILVILAAVLLITKRRMNAND